MATMTVKDAAGSTTTVEKPNSNGRAAASASRPVALSTEDLAAISALATQATLAAVLAKIIAAPATEAKQDTLIGHVDGIETLLTSGNSAQATAANQTTIIGHVDGIEASLASILAKIIAAPATEAKQDALISGVVGNEYETVAASSTDQVLGATGAIGDLITGVLIIPGTTSPGAVSIKDGSGSAISVFAGGASSVSTLHPFFVPLGIKATGAGWKVTTGTNVTAIGVGNFT